MAATPFKGQLVLRSARTGALTTLAFSGSDVANAFATFDDLNAIAQLVVPEESGGYVVDDVLLRSLGVDTTQLLIRKGTTDLPIKLANALLNNFSTDKESRCQGLRGAVLGANTTYFLVQKA